MTYLNGVVFQVHSQQRGVRRQLRHLGHTQASISTPVTNLKYSFHLLEVLNTIVISPKLLQIGHVLQTCKTPQICTFTTQAR